MTILQSPVQPKPILDPTKSKIETKRQTIPLSERTEVGSAGLTGLTIRGYLLSLLIRSTTTTFATGSHQ